ncbi:histidine phosphatase family protein [Sphingosinicella sp. CPCC 101087]|uniref:histidine phosphatase family protein n=1 Tax=Sphingosinicella sp. CPCC 101087 TaxID=2497754 RepID=UPI00101DE7A6|nr:phosphoglycerate mutase family protein [Sphingosinicella sp. CPCC 101087]
MARIFYIARHGETVFNSAARMQGDVLHTPLTRAGFAQADAMGAALRRRLGRRPELELWSSPAGRAQQTLAIVAEHLELDWHTAQLDDRLAEIHMGEWSGRFYEEVAAKAGPLIDPATGLFTRRPPGGEWYDEIALRLQSWLDDHRHRTLPRLVVMHGMSSRVLRGLVSGAPHHPGCGAPIAAAVPQGRIAELIEGRESVVE